MLRNCNKNTNYLRLKDYADDDRPREKLLKHGSHVLSNAELLALIVGSGTIHMNALDLAKNVLKEYNNSLSKLKSCSLEDLQNFKGIGPAKAAVIASVLELNRRFEKATTGHLEQVKKAHDAYLIMKSHLTNKVIEESWVILLNRNSRVLKIIQTSKGGLSKTIVDPAVVLKKVLVYNATSFILVHNHPSGNCAPSKADIQLTSRLEEAAKHIGVRLLDHIIITDDYYFSFGNEGLMAC
ncbi:MAG: DNA repair protein RadC [Bacteroidota bacterium]